MTWGALEVLAGDLFIELLNAQPGRLQELLGDNRCQKLFAIKKRLRRNAHGTRV